MNKPSAFEVATYLHQIANILYVQEEFGKLVASETQICYNACAFEGEVQSGSFRFYPDWMQKQHRSKF